LSVARENARSTADCSAVSDANVKLRQHQRDEHFGTTVSVTAEDIGKRVQDASGRVGILRDVFRDYEDPGEPPGERLKRSVAFLCPEGGGREWSAPPQQVRRI
jgi:hypothetical protein